jgi:hypothetical protein
MLRALCYELLSGARQYFMDYERGAGRNVAHYNAVCYVVSGNMRDVIFSSMAYIQYSGSSNF